MAAPAEPGTTMRKAGKRTKTKKQRHGADVEAATIGQPGPIITLWPRMIAVDPSTLPSEHVVEATVGASLARQRPGQRQSDHGTGMFALRDGTQVRFTTIGWLTVVQAS